MSWTTTPEVDPITGPASYLRPDPPAPTRPMHLLLDLREDCLAWAAAPEELGCSGMLSAGALRDSGMTPST